MHFANSSPKRCLATTGVCILAVLTALTGYSLAAEEVVLCQGNYQTEEQAREQLAKFAATYSDCDQWEKRADNIRKAISKGCRP